MKESEAIRQIKEHLAIAGCEDLMCDVEALEMAINALEKQEKIKEAFEMWKTKTSGYYGADDETTRFISTLNKTLRSDEE